VIKVWHLSWDIDRDARLAISDPILPNWEQAAADGTLLEKMQALRITAAQAGFLKGYFNHVATVDTDDLETAWALTNSVEEPWFTINRDRVTPQVAQGQYRFRSTSIGDLVGFAPLGMTITTPQVSGTEAA
jgi:hypothetical protein